MQKKYFNFIFCLVFVGAFNASADTTYTTSHGDVFTEVQFAEFGQAWRDPRGNIWSGNIGNYTNTITNSAATHACEKIGGRLPSLEEVRALAQYFHTGSQGWLNDQEVADYRALFPSFLSSSGFSYLFWTATLLGTERARISRGLIDPYGDAGNTIQSLAVFCVGR